MLHWKPVCCYRGGLNKQSSPTDVAFCYQQLQLHVYSDSKRLYHSQIVKAMPKSIGPKIVYIFAVRLRKVKHIAYIEVQRYVFLAVLIYYRSVGKVSATLFTRTYTTIHWAKSTVIHKEVLSIYNNRYNV